MQQGFQEVSTGRISVLTKYEPVASHGEPIYNQFCPTGGGPYHRKFRKQVLCLRGFGVGSSFDGEIKRNPEIKGRIQTQRLRLGDAL